MYPLSLLPSWTLGYVSKSNSHIHAHATASNNEMISILKLKWVDMADQLKYDYNIIQSAQIQTTIKFLIKIKEFSTTNKQRSLVNN